MPPKVPNLKFKPKLVVQRKDEEAGIDANDSASSLLAAAPSLTDSTSLQQERLRRLEARHADESQNPIAGMSDYSRIRASDAAASASASAPPTNRPTSTQKRSGTAADCTGTVRTAASTNASAPGRTTHLSAQARLNRAMMQNVDRSHFPPSAPRLPVNTMDAYFTGSNDGTISASEQSRQYRPVSLQSVSAPSETGSAAAPESAIIADGTAFLREGEEETKQSYASNQRFHETVLAPLVDGTTSTATSAAPPLVWAQMPRFSLDAPFDLQRTQAAGKIGELKVYKSGRMVMVIGGVDYDVAVDDESHDGCGTSATMAAVTQPPPYPSDPSSLASCYVLGQLRNKMICTPSLHQL